MRSAPPDGSSWMFFGFFFGIPMLIYGVSYNSLYAVAAIIVMAVGFFHGNELERFRKSLVEEREEQDRKEKERVSWWREWCELRDLYDSGELDELDWGERSFDLLDRMPL